MKSSGPGTATDGATWLLEAQSTDSYHSIRQTYPLDIDFSKLGHLLFSMAGIPIPGVRD